MPAPRAPEPEELGPEEFDFLKCVQCDQPIEFDEDCTEIVIGKPGRGPKSGRLMVVCDPTIDDPPASLHLLCVVPYWKTYVLPVEDALDDYDEEDIFCAKCGVDLSDD
jgi:hypothetical protein